MPAKSVDKLAADTAAAGTKLELGFTIRGRRSAERGAKARLAATGHGPRPGWWSSGLGGKRTCQTIRQKRMRAPVGIDCKPGQRGNERAGKRVDQHWFRKYLWQSSLEALEGAIIPLCPPLRTFHRRDPPLRDGDDPA